VPRTQKKSDPFSIRLSPTTNRYVEAEARRTKRSKGAIVEALAEEAARMRRFPGLGFRGDEPYREAWVMGTGLDVWELIELLQDCGSVERLLADHEHLTRRDVELARAYRAAIAVSAFVTSSGMICVRSIPACAKFSRKYRPRTRPWRSFDTSIATGQEYARGVPVT
jgi:uncharacterized protein DUF433